MARRSAALVCLLLVCLVGLASATVYFKETFDGTSVGFIGWLWHACKCEGGGFFCVPWFGRNACVIVCVCDCASLWLVRAPLSWPLPRGAVSSSLSSLTSRLRAGDWQSRWVRSSAKGADNGKVDVTAGKYFADADKDKGLHTTTDYRFYQYSAKFPEFSNRGKKLIFQFSVKHEQKIDCGGGYFKLLPSTTDLKKFSGDSDYLYVPSPSPPITTHTTPPASIYPSCLLCLSLVVCICFGSFGVFVFFGFCCGGTNFRSLFRSVSPTLAPFTHSRCLHHASCSIMFGPDICGPGSHRVHAILNYKGTNHLIKNEISAPTDEFTHVYTFVLNPDQTFQVLVDGEEKRSGSITDEWELLPPKEIKDPSVSKPAVCIALSLAACCSLHPASQTNYRPLSRRAL